MGKAAWDVQWLFWGLLLYSTYAQHDFWPSAPRNDGLMIYKADTITACFIYILSILYLHYIVRRKVVRIKISLFPTK